jgi:hypothetical protein
MGAATAPDGYPSTSRRLHALHAGVRTHGPQIIAAGLFRGLVLQQELDMTVHGAVGNTPNRTWDDALVRLGCPRLGKWLHHAPDQLWIAEVSDQRPPAPAELDQAAPTRPTLRYIVLTTQRPDSGLVIGPITAVSAAERSRLLGGPCAPGALVGAYIRMLDVLVPVDVETTVVATSGKGNTRYRVRTWLERELLGQDEFEATTANMAGEGPEAATPRALDAEPPDDPASASLSTSALPVAPRESIAAGPMWAGGGS